MKTTLSFLCAFLMFSLFTNYNLQADDGYRLWLRYDEISNPQKLQAYRSAITGFMIIGESPTLEAARKECQMGLNGLLGTEIPSVTEVKESGIVVAGTPESSPLLASLSLEKQLESMGESGFLILSTEINGFPSTVITANTDVGVLYGIFHFLKLVQTHQDIGSLSITNAPKVDHRILNHWDNLDRTVERGYAGFSLWDWQKLPDYISPRYIDYARANASIGINGTVLTNVNANAWVLTEDFLIKVKALADAFRPYGLRVYLTARFSAPVEIGNLETADPLNAEVQAWWTQKANEIYNHIPDFGGFLVKANSEGQPGPQNYDRTHADGANMLADALEPHGGIVMWRAFVYDNEVPVDRAKQAYNEFKPLDGKFRDNVFVQVKNGAVDFQPREPFHPLFGAMPETPLMMEFQITQEYLGLATHLFYQGALYKEVLSADTYAKREGSTVAKVIDGSLHNYSMSGMAGVANIGTDRNWCGHPFGQANWYAFGRLAWDPYLSAEEIAEDWIRMTFTNDDDFIDPVTEMMMASREIGVDYRTPLGLHHLMARGHHYGPGPWVTGGRPDWTSVYYHRADSTGIGFDRSTTGSDAVSQYFPPVAEKFNNLETCPENLLLWFHHVSWDYKMKSGNNLWEELCHKYYTGVDSVQWMQKTWNGLEGMIDEERYETVKTFLKIQEKEAIWWRNSCVLYFQTFSNLPIPKGLEKPKKSLEYYKGIRNRYVPGI